MDWRGCSIRMAFKLGPALLAILSFTAIMVGVIFHAISIDELQYSSPPAINFDTNVIIGDKDTDLVWFLQVTDLHISCRGHFDRERDFKEFTRSYIDIIKPDVVLITGDITDGLKPNSTLSSGPQEKEWIAYREAVNNSGVLDNGKTIWLDIRGNHDNFNVYRPRDPASLYRRYSVKGKDHARNYMEIVTKNGKNYTFIGVDEVQTPGLKVPFNFIGIVADDDLIELKQFKEMAKSNNSDYTIWFAHYPSASIASPNEGLRNIIDGPYLCGHYHTIGNWVTQMHSTQQPGYAEIELGDWKYNRKIRLASIDHQLFNFVDVDFQEFPIALMTNPKKPEFSMPRYEPVDRMANSTHIRVIAFSNTTIKRVEISIDGGIRSAMKKAPGPSPLYVFAWDPSVYATGYHKAEIYVEDEAGLNKRYTQGFSLDGSKNDFTLGAKILIRAYYRNCVMTMFFTIVAICTLPMLALRMIVYKHNETELIQHYRGTFLYNLHLLCRVRRLFIPLILVPLWMAAGPHFVGRLVDEAVGACFVWGILIDGRFIHTGITYVVSTIFLSFIHVSEVILLTFQVSSVHKSIRAGAPVRFLCMKFLIHILLGALQCWMGSLLYSAYGTMSYFTSFPYFWCIFLYNYCWYQCSKLGQNDFDAFSRDTAHQEEQRPLSNGHKTRDDKSSASDQSETKRNLCDVDIEE